MGTTTKLGQARSVSDSLPRWMRRIPTTSGETPEAVPAATIVLLRDAPDAGLETLMVRRSSKLEFAGGMWVFPGGRVDPEDIPPDGDVIEAARHAAVREAQEEAGLVVDADALVPFAHWVPPPVTAKRFATWFVLGPAPEGAVSVAMSEIRDRPRTEPAPARWRRQHRLADRREGASAMADAGAHEPEFFETHVARVEGGIAALWEGAAGSETNDGAAPGARHRLWMPPTGWRLERT